MRDVALLALLVAYTPIGLVQPFCGVLVWVWISVMNPHRETWFVGGTIPVALGVALATILGWLLSREAKRIPISAVSLSFLTLIPLTLVSTIFALNPNEAWVKWDTVFKGLVMNLIILSMLNSKIRIHALVWVLCISIGYFGIKGGIFSVVTGGSNRVWGPAGSYIADNNHLATAMVMVLPLMNYLRQQTANRLVRLGLLATLGLTTLSAMFSYSRGGLLAILAMSVLFWWRGKQKVMMLAVGLGLGAGVMALAPEEWFNRMQSIGEYEEDGSAMGRLEIWRVGLQIAADHPLLGGGFKVTHLADVVHKYSPDTQARAVHNSHLETLIENGIFAFFLHIVLILSTWYYAARVRATVKHDPAQAWAYELAGMLQACLVAFVVGGTFLSLAHYDGWWLLPMLAASLHRCVVTGAQRAWHASPERNADALATAPVYSRGS